MHNDQETGVRARTKATGREDDVIRIAGMNGVRAVACLAVFGVHWQQLTEFGPSWGRIDFGQLLKNGNVGVAVFMMLSGFLLTSGLYARGERNFRASPLAGFWRRRVRRIVPTYLVCLLPLFFLKNNVLSPKSWADLALHVTFTHNFFAETLYSISPPFWALAPIVQFYALFALVVITLRRLNRLSPGYLCLAFAVLAVLAQAAVYQLSRVEPLSGISGDWFGSEAACLHHSLASHLPIFTLGVLAAAIHHRSPHVASFASDGVLTASCLGGLAALSSHDIAQLGFESGRYGFPLIPLGVMAILILIPRSRLTAPLLESAALQRIGELSYSIYLFHLPVLKAVRSAFERAGFSVIDFPLVFGLSSSLLTLAVCVVFHRSMHKTKKQQ
ncbi:MAG: acyltransferase [Planctomycetales bacterium]|nr:acyltransferase [Planctomycetales bacterium]